MQHRLAVFVVWSHQSLAANLRAFLWKTQQTHPGESLFLQSLNKEQLVLLGETL